MGARDIVKKLVPAGLFRAVEPTGHWAEAIAENILLGFPSRGLKVIGVTGTDGKTSTSTLITQMMRSAGLKVAMMTTISVDYGDGKGEIPNPTRLTTMGSLDLLKKIKRIKASGAEWLVLETTSHALAQHRVWGVPYSIAVFTNLGHEHLDYHGTFENYRDAKRLMFKQTNANKKGLRTGIINIDDEVAAFFVKDIANPVTYGVKGGQLQASNIKLTPAGSRYTVKFEETEYHISCHLPGSFNVYNSLAAVGVGRALGLSKEQIEKGIASLHAVEGRMTRVDEGQNFDVIVDYAHTSESFDKIFAEVKPLVKGRMIAVFGSAGRRDEQKRALQGASAGKWCDIVVVTEEDDRDIDGQEILEQIASGAESQGKVKGKNLFLAHDREAAVKEAIKMAKAGDMVLLLGKGHEKSILYNGPKAAELRHHPQNDGDPQRVLKRDYDEVKAARAALKGRSLSAPEFVPSFNWQDVEDVGQAPVLIATRVLNTANLWLKDLDGLAYDFPDGELWRNVDEVEDREMMSFRLPELVLIGDKDGIMQVEAKHLRRWHVLTTEFVPEPPKLLTDVAFSRRGKGKSYRFDFTPHVTADDHHLFMNWRIATIVDTAVKRAQRQRIRY